MLVSFGASSRRGPTEVRLDGHVAEVVVPPPHPERVAEQRAPPGRVDDEIGIEGGTIGGDDPTARAPSNRTDVTRLPSRTSTPGGLRDARAGCGRTAAATPGRRGDSARSSPGSTNSRAPGRAPHHRRPELSETAGVLDLLTHAQRLEDRHGRRQKGLSDVRAGEPFPLEQRHAVAAPGEHRGRGRAARAAPDDDDVAHPRGSVPTVAVASTPGRFVAGSTWNASTRPSSRPISRTAGSTSSPMSRSERIESSWLIEPSPSQKKICPGRRVSSTWRTLGRTVFGVPVMIIPASSCVL